MGLAPTLGNSPGQGDLLQSPSPARSLLNATFPHALASGGFGAGLLPEKAFPPSRDPHHQRAPVFDIAQKYCHKIKYETSHSRQTVLDSPRPALHIAAARKQKRVEKGRQA
ncbi:hypothetical protein JTE90_000686, partial [Oedothorax gibbosus]